jgi:conjugal transfer pilus assembly protein TraL
MADEVTPIRMPRYCDDGMMFMMWSADELLPGFAIFLLGVMINQKIICLVVAIVATKMFRRMKEGNPDGFLLHSLYWIGLVDSKRVKSMPSPFVREYID